MDDEEPSVKGEVKGDNNDMNYDYLGDRNVDDLSEKEFDEEEARQLAEFAALSPEERAELVKK